MTSVSVDEVAAAAQPAPAAPFRDRRFLIFAAGNVVNNVGDAVFATILPLLAYRLTGSLSVMALLSAAVPVATLLAPPLGTIVDRWGPRAIVVPGLLLEAGAALMMNLLLLAGKPNDTALFVCALLVAIGGYGYRVGWMSAVPSMFPTFHIRARAGLNSLYFTSLLIGPAIVGLGLAALGYPGLLWLDLATFFAPIAVWLMGVHPPKREREPEPKPDTPARRRGLLEGWRAVVSDRRILVMMASQSALLISWGTGLNSLIVYSLRATWGVSASGASGVLTLMNVAMLVGNLLVVRTRMMRPWPVLFGGTVLCAAALFLLAVPNRDVFVAASVLGAAAVGAVMTMVVVMRVSYLPQEVLGRATGVLLLITGTAELLSPAAAPSLVRLFGERGSYAVLAAVPTVIACYVLYGRRAWRPAPAVESTEN
jgi:MFS family permease